MGNSNPAFRLVEGDAVTATELERSLEILRAAFGRWPCAYRLSVPDVEHLRWKIEGAGDRPSHVAFTEIDGQIVTLAIHQPARLLVKGQPRLARYGTEAATHPDYQGRGIYSKRRDYQRAHWDHLYDLTFEVTHNARMLHLREKRGLTPMQNPLRVLLRPYDARRLFEAGARRGLARLRLLPHAPARALSAAGGLLLYAPARALSAALRLLHPQRAPAAPSWSLRETRAFDERADEFARRAAEPFDLIQLRDRRFLNWRYFDPRTPNATVWVAEEGGELLGFVAYRTEGAEGYLIDLLALPGRLDVAHSLAAHAERALRKSGVMVARCWIMRRHPYVPVLHACGFIPSGYETGFGCYALRMPASELEFMSKPDARIHFTLADLDTV
jgi:hypothetical protein